MAEGARRVRLPYFSGNTCPSSTSSGEAGGRKQNEKILDCLKMQTTSNFFEWRWNGNSMRGDQMPYEFPPMYLNIFL
jgi:hypothetical protein